MQTTESEQPIVDTGLAPKFYISGLANAEIIDGCNVRLSYFATHGSGPNTVRQIEIVLIAPLSAIQPAIEVCALQLGYRLIAPRGPDLSIRMLA